MNTQPEPELQAMPKAAELFLTNKMPCAALVLLMLTSAYWFNALFGSIPLLGFVVVLVGMLLMLAVPTVFALVTFGGGLSFSLQVGGIVALAILILSSGSLNLALGFLVLFVLLPTASALKLQREDGLHLSAWSMAIGLLVVTFIAMALLSSDGIKGAMLQMLSPLFDNMIATVPAGDQASLSAIQDLRDIMVLIFPGIVVFSIWLTWWGDVLYARKLALKYGFYRGDDTHMFAFRLPKQFVFSLIGCIALANMASGDIAYVATNALLVLAGLVAVQGVVVAHTWLKQREMGNTIVIMYVMLFFWSAVVLLFMIVGLLDIWFNYRRNMVSTTGEK